MSQVVVKSRKETILPAKHVKTKQEFRAELLEQLQIAEALEVQQTDPNRRAYYSGFGNALQAILHRL